MRSCSVSSSPTRATPSSTAVTAGTAPRARIAAVHRARASALAGDGRPRLEKIVDSRATTATPSDSAVATSSDNLGSSTASVCQRTVGAGGAAGLARRRRTWSPLPRGASSGTGRAPRSGRGGSRGRGAVWRRGPATPDRSSRARAPVRAAAANAAEPGLPSPLRAGSAITTSTALAACPPRPDLAAHDRRRPSGEIHRGVLHRRSRRLDARRTARRGHRGEAEQPDTGVRVDHVIGSVDLGRRPADRIDEQPGGDRSRLEERSG